MEELNELKPEKLWELLKDNAQKNLRLANQKQIESNACNTTVWDALAHRYVLFLDENGCQIEEKLIEKLPKNGINLTHKQKLDILNNVLQNTSLEKISYQSLLTQLRSETTNKMTYLFGIANVKINISEDFKINDRLQIGHCSYCKGNPIFNEFILQSEFFKKDNSYILVTVSGPDDNETARKAENEASTFVNVLNCLYCDRSETIELMTKIDESNKSSVFFYLKKKSDNSWSESRSVRPDKVRSCVILNKSRLNVVKSLYEGKRTKFTKLIFAMNWLGKSLKETDYGSAFLEVIIGLECIAEKQSRGLVSPAINYQISNFVAMILGKNIEKRKLIIGKMKKAYNKRSLIVHDGKDSITYDDYKDIFILVRKLIHTIIYDSPFRDIDDLNSWVEEKLLS